MTRLVLAMVAAVLVFVARPAPPARACGAKVSVRAPGVRRVLVARQAAAAPLRAAQPRRPIRTGPVVRSEPERRLVSSAATSKPDATESSADVAATTSADAATTSADTTDVDTADAAAKAPTADSERVAMADTKVEPKERAPRHHESAANAGGQRIYFAQSTAALSGRAKARLLGVVRLWKRRGADREITVEGHCSAIGPDKPNQALSEVRAQIVKDFLVEQGIDESKIETVGYGFNKPEFKPASSPKNRRVVIRFDSK